ncbi:unnamed protein product [Lactuca saligna]|uniref:F-box domain-containing protein n=1 Tax=Lactuca saligna TaxID=75948 RepID=A0AA35ZWC5_LACSI|nr:unnamed protein product [Lactuca saligna]
MFQEVVEKVKEDAISALPDCLLQEILSHFPSTKDAIKTGILSKRWKHLWTSIPTLIFSHSDYYHLTPYFHLLVDKTLTQCHQLKLKKLEVHTIYDIQFESVYNNWIRYAIRCNVEELNLGFHGWELKFLLDQSFFFPISSCFTDLRLSCFMLNPTGAISWKNLRSLYINNVNLDEGLFLNIISGSPLLETLVFKKCHGYTSNEINAPNISSVTQFPQLKLKKFKVCSCFDIQFQSQLKSWIPYAIRCNVEVLKLDLWKTEWGDDFMLDQILFTRSCLTDLKLVGA